MLQQDSIPVAIKEQVHPDLQTANAAVNEALSQIQLDHSHICKLYSCSLEQEPNNRVKSVLVMELMSHDLGKEIEDRRLNGTYWTEYELIYHLREVASALAYAQSRFVSHRDIKPNNLFLSTDGKFKVGDFGSSKKNMQSAVTTTLHGSPFYLSPELKRMFCLMLYGEVPESAYDPFKSDVYSLGLTFLHAALLEIPREMTKLDHLQEVTETIIRKFDSYPGFQHLLAGMLVIVPDQRWSFEDIVQGADTYLNWVNSQYLQEPLEQGWNKANSEEGKLHCANYQNCAYLISPEMRDSVTLTCFHTFHSQICFLDFLSKNKDQYSQIYQCPVCGTSITRENLPGDMGKPVLKCFKTKGNKVLCSKCSRQKPESTFPCGHKICRKCQILNVETKEYECPRCSI